MTPFTGLGLYGGFRGNRWLRNRIQIFKQFVIPSLQNQTDTGFIHWVTWRPQEKDNPLVQDLYHYMIKQYRTVFTFGGLCFWDDKFEDKEAREKLALALRRTLPELSNKLGRSADVDEIQVLLVPSDDLYSMTTIRTIKSIFEDDKNINAVGFTKGYICNYHTKEVLEYNPTTNPPFFAARFPRKVFFDAQEHMNYISTKKDEGKYPAGTPYPSHEWIPNAFNLKVLPYRGFMVGTHGENISTHFNHPFRGQKPYDQEGILSLFGINDVPNLKLPLSLRKKIMRRLPYKVQRKLRYIFGEKLWNTLYQFLRN